MTRVETIGNATLYLGDSREVMPTLGQFDALVTDPPYGVLSQSCSAATRRSSGNTTNSVVEWDVSLSADTVAAIQGAAESCMIWGGCHMPLPPTFGYLIWDKVCEGLNFGEVEYCWTNMRFAPRMFRFRAAGMDGGKEHPTQKPVQVMAWCLGFVPKAKTVLDPFMGSGTTGVACARLGRQFTGIEIEPRYFDVACRRIEEAYRQADMFVTPPASAPRKPADLFMAPTS